MSGYPATQSASRRLKIFLVSPAASWIAATSQRQLVLSLANTPMCRNSLWQIMQTTKGMGRLILQLNTS